MSLGNTYLFDKFYIEALADNVPDFRYDMVHYYFKKKYNAELSQYYSDITLMH